MIDATAERALLSRIERLEKIIATMLEVHRTLLKAQFPFMPETTSARAERRLEEATDLLKNKGTTP